MLILATGTSHSYFGHNEFAEYATGLKSLADADAARNKRDLKGQPFRHRQAVSLDRNQLTRVIAQEPHGVHAEFAQNLHSNSVISLISLVSDD